MFYQTLKISFLFICLTASTLYVISCSSSDDDPSPAELAANSSGTEGQFLFNSSACELDSIYRQSGFGGPFGAVFSNDTSLVTYTNGLISDVVTERWETATEEVEPGEFVTSTRFLGTDRWSIETINGNRITKITKETNGNTVTVFEGTYEDNKLVSFLQSETTKYELIYNNDLLSFAEQLSSADGGIIFDPVRTFDFTVSDGNITEISWTQAGETEPNRIEKFTFDDNPNFYAGGVAFYLPVNTTLFVNFNKNNILSYTVEIPNNPEDTFSTNFNYSFDEGQNYLKQFSTGGGGQGFGSSSETNFIYANCD
ncbi:MAG: hypothetical protein AAF519_14275 [Bacteroidota bacterium]